MNLMHNIGLIFYLLPYTNIIKNRWSLILSILFGRSKYKIKLDDGHIINFDKSQYDILRYFLGSISFATTYHVNSDKTVEISFDNKNKFTIPIENLSLEDNNLLELIFMGTRNGADFSTNESDDENKFRSKTTKIIQGKDRKIIETSKGIKFYLDSIHPGNSIVETFVSDIHSITNQDNWNDKIVIDVGAECGDTALYYSSLGAKVFAFEPIKNNFNSMVENLELNPDLSKRITPINAAIGKDGKLKFYQAEDTPDIGASFVYNKRGKNAKISIVEGYSLESALKKFNIEHVDLLKMDCKACEFFLTENGLKSVDSVKIEYIANEKDRKLDDLVKTLENVGFKIRIYRVDQFQSGSNKMSGHIYGKKLK